MYSGIPKFPLEVDLNDKMQLLEVEYGLKGFAIVIKLFQYIYNKSYYTKWDIDVGLLFIKDKCPQESWKLVSEVAACAIRRGIFDQAMFEKYSILTSSRIQETYLEVAKRRKQIELVPEYLLPIAYKIVNDVNISGKIVYKSCKNADTCAQGKERRRKGKERRENAPACEASLSQERMTEILPGIVFDCTSTLTEDVYKAIGEEIKASPFLRETFKTLSKIHKYAPQILAGNYRQYKKNVSGVASSDVVSNSPSAQEINALFCDVSPDEM